MSVEAISGAEAREAQEREIARRNGFEAAFLDHYRSVLAYAMRRTTSPDLAEDVAADTFAVAWRRWDSRPTDPLPWLYGIARRVLANARRGDSRRRALTDRVALGDPVLVSVDPADGVVERDVIFAALSALAPNDREALMLTEWEGLEVREAAQVLGCSTGALHVRLHRARRRLAKRLGRDA